MTPPYASDTRAKGWRFEIDHERIRQSDTWALAAADVRPWLLMLWMVAWEQAPCGSLPEDGALIAARLGMAPKAFEKHRAVLLRGWQEAEDGRLYHPVITERVLEMVDYRAKAAARKAAYRDSHGSPAVVPRDSTVANDTGTGTGTLKEKKKAPAAQVVGLEAIPQDLLDEWKGVRSAKRAGRIAPTVVKALEREAAKAGLSVEGAIRKCVERAWVGFEADWLKDPKQKAADVARMTTPGPPPSTTLADMAAHRELAEAERLARLARKAQAA